LTPESWPVLLSYLFKPETLLYLWFNVLLTWRLTSIVVCDDIWLYDFWLFDWLTHNNNISSCTNLIMSAFFHITIYFLTTCPSKKWLDLNLPPVITMYRQIVLYYYWMNRFITSIELWEKRLFRRFQLVVSKLKNTCNAVLENARYISELDNN
jgi:hypothetical protein